MKTPSFRYMGGKARLRKWLVSLFPTNGRSYVEPFAGRGNVFFEAVQRLSFKNWLLSDQDTEFLEALLTADFSMLPACVDRDVFERLRKTPKDVISLLVEPRVTFAGKGYASGFSGSSGTHVGYSRQNYLAVCVAAKSLLTKPGVVVLDCASWESLPWSSWSQDDFVYLDPPYFGTKASYPNIDHCALAQVLNRARFRWALSGYANQAYEQQLNFKSRFECVRNSEIKSSNTHNASPVTEVLWTNWASNG